MSSHDAPSGLLPCLGRYQLIKRLAMGGMAEIYLARAEGAEGFAKPVVIKRILPARAEDPEHVALFVEEARLAARLGHANLTQIFDFEEEPGGGFYMAMEYVHGRDLREVLDRCAVLRRRLGDVRALHVAVEVLEGLTYAHDATRRGRPLEIVHRDISPRNVLVGFNGDVKLTDFGIARGRGLGVQEEGVVRGKVLYMSPEQVRGLALDHRSDHYSLALVLYEMLTGRRALAGADGAPSIVRTARAEFVPLAQARPDLPAGLLDVMQRALAYRPQDRFASGRDFLHALRTVLLQEVRTPTELEVGRFLTELFPEVTDLTITLSAAEALLVLRESSSGELSGRLRAALDEAGSEDGPHAPGTGTTRPDRGAMPAADDDAHDGGRRGDEAGGHDHGAAVPSGRDSLPHAAATPEAPHQPPEESTTQPLAAAPAPEPAPELPPTVLSPRVDPSGQPVAHELLATVVSPPLQLPAAAASAGDSDSETTTRSAPVLHDTELAAPASGADLLLDTVADGPPLAALTTATAPANGAPLEAAGLPAAGRRWRRVALHLAWPVGLLIFIFAGVWGLRGLSRSGDQRAQRSGPATEDPGRRAPDAGSNTTPFAPSRVVAAPPATPDPARPVPPTVSPSAPPPAAAPPPRRRPPAAPVTGSPATASPATGVATLTVNATPYAQFWVDGDGPYPTPLTLRLPPGAHQIRLRNSALGTERTQRVQLRPGDRQVRSFDMLPHD